MSWADTKIKEYQQGHKANFLEKVVLEHANPVHFLLAVIGCVCAVYGLWIHSALWIILGIALNFLGHVYCWLKN